MKNQLLAALIIAVLFGGQLFSQPQNFLPKNDYKKLGTEVKDYATKEIQPILKIWKDSFDKSISKEDLKKLNELRSKAKEIKYELFKNLKDIRQKRDTSSLAEKAKMLRMREKMRMQNPNEPKNAPFTEAKEPNKQRTKLSHDTVRTAVSDLRAEARNKMEAVVAELLPFMEKNKDKLSALRPEMETKGKEWKERINDIIDKWKEEQFSDTTAQDNKRKIRPGRFIRQRDYDKKKFAVKFLLWDGNPEELNDEFGPNTNMLESGEVMGISVNLNEPINTTIAPNPFKEKTVVSFFLSFAQKVKIRLINQEGKELAILNDGELKEGTHSFTINSSSIQGLSAGALFLSIEGNKFRKTQTIVYEK